MHVCYTMPDIAQGQLNEISLENTCYNATIVVPSDYSKMYSYAFLTFRILNRAGVDSKTINFKYVTLTVPII